MITFEISLIGSKIFLNTVAAGHLQAGDSNREELTKGAGRLL